MTQPGQSGDSRDQAGLLASLWKAINRAQAMIEFDLQGNILTANENYLTILGYTLEEIVGKHHSMFCEAAFVASDQYRHFWDRLGWGEFEAAEYKRLGKGGREVWLQASYNPIFDMAGRPIKVVKFAVDVTAAKLMNAEFQGKVNAINRAQAMIEFDLQGNVLTANENYLAMLGYTLPEIVGRHHAMFCSEALIVSPAYTDFWLKLGLGDFEAGRFMRLGKSGRRVWIQASYNPIFDINGRPCKVVKFATDITALVEAEIARTVAEARFRAAQEVSPEGFVVFEAIRSADHQVEDFTVSYANPAAARLLHPASDKLADGRLRDLFPDETHRSNDLVEIYGSVLATGKALIREFRHQAPGRHVRWLRHRAVPLDDGVAVGFEDITYRRRTEEQVRNLALHDSLTGLPNRYSFRESMAEALADQHRANGGFAILSLDLDRFKNVNDTLGHQAGDKLLQIVAQRLRRSIRADDVVARLGGDEFAILLMSSGLSVAEALSRRLITALSEPYQLDGYCPAIGVSVGIVVVPGDGNGDADLERLLKHADLALYRAKAEGRGTYCVFAEPMVQERQARLDLERDLCGAITRGELELYYQPVFDLHTNRLSGFEALARWHHATRGLISPAEFIPVSEECGLIIPIGEWVLRRACADAVGWPDGLKVAVNLSAVQFAGTDLAQTVSSVLVQTGLAAQRLELEITESVLLQQNEAVLKALHCLRASGVRVALDDFGTKYSSLSYLRSFPFDKIKIDQSFVRDALGRPDCLAIVRSVASLGHELGMIVTAEGVERAEHLAMVREAGCTEAQGYYLAGC